MREEHPERKMILDNSAYEFFIKGEELDLDEYVEAIIELNPDYYILPDTLMNREKTILDVIEFRVKHQQRLESYFNGIEESIPQPITVVQGNTVNEFNSCLSTFLNMGYTNIAIPFHNTFFKEIEECDPDVALSFISAGYNIYTEDVRYAIGRCVWMKEYGLDILSPNGSPQYTMLHFLGSHCPAEKKYLNTLFSENSQISMDTGYPVKLAIEGRELGKESAKPKTIIDDFMYNEFNDEEQKLIVNNVNTFRNY